MKRHYAKRMCPISYAFGGYVNGDLIGVVTYGTPSSSPLRKGICGKTHAHLVLELNRLCCENKKNFASTIVGRSLQMLPKPTIVVSFADTAQGHVGFVYQATNFLYTGLSAKHTDWKIKGMEHLHASTVVAMGLGQADRLSWIKAKFGDDFYISERSRKHRYVYFVGTRKQKKELMGCLMYKQEPYPKGNSIRYESEGAVKSQRMLFT